MLSRAKSLGGSYLAEQFHQITHYLAEQFRQITHYLVEQFRQITQFLAEPFPPNNTLFGRTVSPNSTLFGGTPDSEKLYLVQWKVDFMNHTSLAHLKENLHMQVCRYVTRQLCKYAGMKNM